jgi:hypothetical protein
LTLTTKGAEDEIMTREEEKQNLTGAKRASKIAKPHTSSELP